MAFASSPIAVQNVVHRVRTALGDILDCDWPTPELQSSCQGPWNSKRLVHWVGEEKAQLCQKKVSSPINSIVCHCTQCMVTYLFFIYLI